MSDQHASWRVRSVALAKRIYGSPRVRVGVLMVLVVIAVVSLADQWDHVHRDLRRLSVADLAVAAIVGALPVLAGGMSWRALLSALGETLPPRTALTAFAIGQMGKYMPGSVWPVLMQGELVKREGVRRDRALPASVLALVLSLAGSLLVSTVAFGISGDVAAPLMALLVVGALLVLVLLHPPVLTWAVERVLRTLKRPPLAAPLSRSALLRALAWSCFGSLALGVHAWLLARALGGHHGAPVARSIGGFSLAWLAGFVVPLAPAGGGVRELVLYGTFAPVLGHHAAYALAAVSRLVLTFVDLVASGLAAVLRPRPGDDGQRHRPSPSPGGGPMAAPGAL
ncbi:MAG TPA: lysylphosphatidylglycerol synthase transmembrane domain-containing protein [Mycobacteriales bacterium]|nr:lysylphosphatidylglycerol synthase transmembrane domain-containing protein [Mycobacteriales bacterium]